MRTAFTLIEVMIVLSIVALLSGMLMPVVSLAQKRANKTNTLALLRKVETGLELFRGEMDTYPHQLHDSADPFPAADNRLAWTLGRDLTLSERTALNTDLATARAVYAAGGVHALDRTEIDPTYTHSGLPAEEKVQYGEMAAGLINRMGAERATLAVLAGNREVEGIRGRNGQRILDAPQSHGFARDYLAFDLNAKNIRGDAIIDCYGRELIYVCPVVQGMRSFHAPENIFKDRWHSTPHEAIEVGYYQLGTTGRSLATSMASDIRTTAASAYQVSFELWSAGPDGRIDPLRDGSANTDNIAARDYNRELR